MLPGACIPLFDAQRALPLPVKSQAAAVHSGLPCPAVYLTAGCRMSVVKAYCGHGIGDLFHCAPSVPHYSHNKVGSAAPPSPHTWHPPPEALRPQPLACGNLPEAQQSAGACTQGTPTSSWGTTLGLICQEQSAWQMLPAFPVQPRAYVPGRTAHTLLTAAVWPIVDHQPAGLSPSTGLRSPAAGKGHHQGGPGVHN